MYPDITIDLPHEFRIPYMELLLMMAASDGDLVREELSVVEAYMGKLMIHPDERIGLRKKLENSRTYKQIISDLDEDLLKSALRDCLVVGVSDGVLDEKERSFAKRLAKSAGVSEEALSELCDWAIEGWNWHKKSATLLSIKSVDKVVKI